MCFLYATIFIETLYSAISFICLLVLRPCCCFHPLTKLFNSCSIEVFINCLKPYISYAVSQILVLKFEGNTYQR